MRILTAAALWAFAGLPALAQTTDTPIIVEGTCDPQSGVTINDEEPNQFACTVAIIARTDRGTVLIQFTDKTGDDGRILGFAGTIEGKQGFGANTVQALAVERLYLAGGAEPVPANRGTCFLNWTGLHRTGGKLTSVTCGAAGQVDSYQIKAIAALKARRY